MNTVIIILIGYLTIVILMAVYASRKVKHPADYYVAGRSVGLMGVSGSLLATILGGSAILGTIELSQKIGWAALWFLFCAALGLLALVPLAKKVKRFGNYTLPELLGRFFGKKAQIAASAIIPIAWLGIIAAQIIAAAKIITGLDVINYTSAAILSGVVFIVYTLLGGQKSIVKTDILQSVLIFFGLTALVFFSVKKGLPGNYVSFSIDKLFNNSFQPFDLLILIMTYSVTFLVGPDIYSRIFCANNEKTATRSVLLVAILLIPLSVALTYLGVYSSGSGSLLLVGANLLPDWAYGLLAAALLSAVMSSADTTLLTSSLIITQLTNRDMEKSLIPTKVLVIIIGTVSIIVALFITSVIQSLLFALAFFSGAFVIPVLLGLTNRKIVEKQFLPAVLLGGIVALIGKIIAVNYHPDLGNSIIVLAFAVNYLLLKVRVFK